MISFSSKDRYTNQIYTSSIEPMSCEMEIEGIVVNPQKLTYLKLDLELRLAICGISVR